MAQFVLTDAFVSLNAVDISDHVRSVTLTATAAEVDDTAMGATSLSRIKGLKDFSISLELIQDFAASKTDATIWACYAASGSHAIEVRPTSGSVSATNPKFTGNVIVNDYKPLQNAFGELATVSVTWPGDGDLTRATS